MPVEESHRPKESWRRVLGCNGSMTCFTCLGQVKEHIGDMHGRLSGSLTSDSIAPLKPGSSREARLPIFRVCAPWMIQGNGWLQAKAGSSLKGPSPVADLYLNRPLAPSGSGKSGRVDSAVCRHSGVNIDKSESIIRARRYQTDPTAICVRFEPSRNIGRRYRHTSAELRIAQTDCAVSSGCEGPAHDAYARRPVAPRGRHPMSRIVPPQSAIRDLAARDGPKPPPAHSTAI